MNQTYSTEDQLRAEVESLRRQLEEQKKHPQPKPPSAWTGVTVFVLLLALGLAGYYFGYLPRQKREMVLAAESQNTVGLSASGERYARACVPPAHRIWCCPATFRP